ncbi:hypothetical protein [Roseivirga seohaensis]|uniref:hypothetical protein n=1 Tax=Roseivirga seohaensis TaxID=1914963 RepID=UPI003BAD8D32
MNLSISKTGVQVVLSIILMFTLLATSILLKIGALSLGLAIMVWATLNVEGFYPKPNKKVQAVWLGILGGLTLIVLGVYVLA